MREAYKDVMDRIEVTPEMQTRILKAIRDADIQGRSKRAVPMGRLAIAACLALLVAGAVALPKLPAKPPEKRPVRGAKRDLERHTGLVAPGALSAGGL